MSKDENIAVLANGEIHLWVEQDSSIHIKAITSYGDPVELSANETKKLIDKLQEMLNDIK